MTKIQIIKYLNLVILNEAEGGVKDLAKRINPYLVKSSALALLARSFVASLLRMTRGVSFVLVI